MSYISDIHTKLQCQLSSAQKLQSKFAKGIALYDKLLFAINTNYSDARSKKEMAVIDSLIKRINNNISAINPFLESTENIKLLGFELFIDDTERILKFYEQKVYELEDIFPSLVKPDYKAKQGCELYKQYQTLKDQLSTVQDLYAKFCAGVQELDKKNRLKGKDFKIIEEIDKFYGYLQTKVSNVETAIKTFPDLEKEIKGINKDSIDTSIQNLSKYVENMIKEFPFINEVSATTFTSEWIS